MAVPELPLLEEEERQINAFSALNGNASTSTAIFKYQRAAKPSRQTKWQKQRKRDAMKAAASGSVDIRAMFARQPAVLTTTQSSPEATREEIILKAIHDLKRKLGLTTAARLGDDLNDQTKTKYRAVLHFLYAQKKCKTSTRQELSLSVAHTFNRGKHFAETIVRLERGWVKNREIVEGLQGIHTKISTLFNDESVRLFVMEFVRSKGE